MFNPNPLNNKYVKFSIETAIENPAMIIEKYDIEMKECDNDEAFWITVESKKPNRLNDTYLIDRHMKIKEFLKIKNNTISNLFKIFNKLQKNDIIRQEIRNERDFWFDIQRYKYKLQKIHIPKNKKSKKVIKK